MNIKYFNDTDTLLVNFSAREVFETRDFNQDVLIDLDNEGNIVSFTVEHARKQADMPTFSFQQIAAG